jgi:hypothetical protein
MSKTNKTTELVVKKETTNLPTTVANITQDDLPAMLRVVDAKIAALRGSDEKEETSSSSELPLFGKISEINDPLVLRAAYAHIMKKVEGINAHNEVFKAVAPTINVPVYKENGNTVEQWKKIILNQYKKVVFKEELDKLQKAKDKIQNNLSQKDKMRADLADAFNLLGIGE